MQTKNIATDFMISRINLIDVDRTRIVTAPGLEDEMAGGIRTYMDRRWPMSITYRRSKIFDSSEMRIGYRPLSEIMHKELEHLSAGREQVVVRFNIPMNPEVGWFNGKKWIFHQAPMDRNIWFIEIDPEFRTIFANKGIDNIQKGHMGIATTVLSNTWEPFNKRAFINGTYDPRHIVDLQYVFPKRQKGVKQARNDLIPFARKRSNALLSGLTCHYGSTGYYPKAQKLIKIHGWSTYARTLLAVPLMPTSSSKKRVYLIKTNGLTPMQIHRRTKEMLEPYGNDDVVIFGCTEGGSFGIGTIDATGKTNEWGKPADYSRGPEGMFALCLDTPRGVLEKGVLHKVDEIEQAKSSEPRQTSRSGGYEPWMDNVDLSDWSGSELDELFGLE